MQNESIFIKTSVNANRWDTSVVSWNFYPIAKREMLKGMCFVNIKLVKIDEKKEVYSLVKDTQRMAKILIFADDPVERIFLISHELFHFLITSKQLNPLYWKDREFHANIFGLFLLLRYLKGENIMRACPLCKNTSVLVSYKLRSNFNAVVDIGTYEVLERPNILKKSKKGPKGILLECEICGTIIPINGGLNEKILELMEVYDYGEYW